MIIVLLMWFILGGLFGMAIASIAISAYGSTDLNEKIKDLRRNRWELEKAKTYIQFKKAVIRLDEILSNEPELE